MEKEEILSLFQDFLKEYDQVEKDEIWQRQSNIFKTFWNEKIIKSSGGINDYELDSIIRILDRNAYGNTSENEAIAKMLISQGVWRRMFDQLKSNQKLSQLLDQVIGTFNIEERIKLVNELYKYNEPYRNSLTGKRGNAINAFMFIWAPQKNISVVSLGDRQRLLQFFKFEGGPNFEKDTQGEKIVKSNEALVNGFKSYFGSQYSPRTVCVFLYHSAKVREAWRSEDIGDEDYGRGWSPRPPEAVTSPILAESKNVDSDLSLFYMESQLEDFIVENWDKTELGKKYDLFEENGEIGQQYRIGVGIIDILAQDKKTKQLVVIELKKNQSSDDTVGQLARYMGWLESHKTGGKPTKGIIIAAHYDPRLYYALKKLPESEVYLYRVDFRLEEFTEHPASYLTKTARVQKAK